MKKTKKINKAASNSSSKSSQPNPYNLFLILILLINSYGIASSLTKKSKNRSIKKDRRNLL